MSLHQYYRMQLYHRLSMHLPYFLLMCSLAASITFTVYWPLFCFRGSLLQLLSSHHPKAGPAWHDSSTSPALPPPLVGCLCVGVYMDSWAADLQHQIFCFWYMDHSCIFYRCCTSTTTTSVVALTDHVWCACFDYSNWLCTVAMHEWQS